MNMVLRRLDGDPSTLVGEADRLCSGTCIHSGKAVRASKSDISEKETRSAPKWDEYVSALGTHCADGRAQAVGQVLCEADLDAAGGSCSNRPRAAFQPRENTGNKNPSLAAF
jgi:hypothetical protein